MLLGVVAGGLWNVLNLWCLTHLLRVWVGTNPSTRRALAWAAVKFPVLYGAAIALIRNPSVSIAGFCLGFTGVLLAAGLRSLFIARRSEVLQHG